jgi:hypothetical protein
MPELHHVWTETNPFQAPNTTISWTWPVGEGEHYWGYSVRPFQLNNDGVEIVRQFTTTDNDFHWTEHFDVRTSSESGLIRFSAISVIGA